MPSPIELRLATREEIESELARTLAGNDALDAMAVDCEFVRAALWATTRGGPVHINGILSFVVRLALVYTANPDEETTRKRLRRTLDVLAEVGDVLELDQGRWSPTAPRLVDLGSSFAERLFIGGVPTGSLPESLQATLSHREALRFARGQDLERALALRVDTVDSWAGIPPLPLRDWAAALSATPLTEYTEPPDAARVEVYAPHSANSRNQSGRWVEPLRAKSGRHLARRTRVFGAVEYQLVEMDAGRICETGNILMPGEGRRMMYASDASANRTVEVSIASSGETMTLTYWSELPSAERRLLWLVGSVKSLGERYYPRIWTIPRRWEKDVRRRIEALEITISDTKERGRS